MEFNKNSDEINILKNNLKILKNNLKNILVKFKKLDFNNEKQVNEFLKYLIEVMDYVISIFKEIKNKKNKGGTCIKCNNFKGGVSPADRSISDQQQSRCFICTGEPYERTRSLSRQQLQELGPLIGHEESEGCQQVAHVECWRQFFNSPIRHVCPNCGKNLDFQEDENGVRIVVPEDEEDDDDDDNDDFDDQLNNFIDNNRRVDNDDIIYKSLRYLNLYIFLCAFKEPSITRNPFNLLILFFCANFFLGIINKYYRRNPHPSPGLVALGYITIPFIFLIEVFAIMNTINRLSGNNYRYSILNIIEIIYEKLNRDGIENPDFNLLREEILNYDVNNALDIANIYGGNKKSKKKKIKMNKTKKNRYFNSLNPLLETNYLKMLSYKKQKGSGTIYSRFRNSSVQPEQNYVYSDHNNTQVVPLDFVTPHQYSKFRCIWKRGTPKDEFMENDPDGNRVHDWIIVIFNPIDRNESDWLFAGTTDETVLDDVEYEIRHYRSLLLPSFFENVWDYISEKFLSTYDIRLKIYELLAIKYYIRYNPIQEARAEIIRHAEPAYIANGGKKNKNKTKKR
tara:strand:+ start:9847 stop:11547 length:1701 start_codon:yes stop_codon:yes gene_type:complete